MGSYKTLIINYYFYIIHLFINRKIQSLVREYCYFFTVSVLCKRHNICFKKTFENINIYKIKKEM
jgi:hypothetical protein